jgi:hypothetical protein
MSFDYLRCERYFTSKEDGMIRMVFAVAVAALAVTAAFGASQAAPNRAASDWGNERRRCG